MGKARVEVSLKQGGVIAGVVVDRNGTPQSGWTVWTDSRSSSTSTGDDGAFELRGVEPGERTVSARRGGMVYGKSKAKLWNDKTKVAAGETARVRIVVDAHDGVIAGRVVDGSGAAVADAFIQAVVEGASSYRSDEERARQGWGVKPVITGADGGFELTGLGPGTYLVRAYRKSGGEAFKKKVEPGAEITLTIAETVTLSGSVTTEQSDPIDRFKIAVRESKTGLERQETFFMTAGRWAIADLPAGQYTVRALADQGEASKNVRVAPGDSTGESTFSSRGRRSWRDTPAVVPALKRSDEKPGDLGFEVKRPAGPMFSRGVQAYDIVVESLKPGGAAAEAGLRKGDVITEVEGFDVTGHYAARYTLLFGRGIAKGRTLRYRLKSGATISITAR